MSLTNWNKNQILKLSIDYDKVDNDLIDFPVLINLADSSGKNNYDCSDIFDKFDFTSVDDDFTGDDNTPPNSKLWYYQNGAIIKDNQLCNINTTGNITTNYVLTSDFDIRVDFNLPSTPSEDRWHVFLTVKSQTSSKYWGINRGYYSSEMGGHAYGILEHDGTNWYWRNHNTTSDTSGTLRIVREASTLTYYYKDDNTWTSLGTNTTSLDSINLKVNIATERHDNITAFTCYFDNYTLTDSQIKWPPNKLPTRKKIAIVYPSIQEHYVTISGTKVLKTYTHGEQEQLYCEIERWDQTNKSAQLWVKIPKILSDQPTDIYLYYDETQEDNTSYIGDTGDWAAQQVWNSNFVFVSHMAQDPSGTAPQILDSTSYKSNGTSYGSMTSDDLVDGTIGKVIEFDGTDDYINYGYKQVHDITDTLTIEATFTPDSLWDSNLSSSKGLVSRIFDPNDSEDTYSIIINTDGKLHLGTNGGNIQSTKTSWAANTEFIVAGTYNYNNGSPIGDLFINGVKETLSVDNYDTMAGSTNNLVVGKNNSNANEFADAKFREVRISNIIRSQNWIAVTNSSLKDMLLTFSTADIYLFTGYVKELNVPVQRKVYLYERESGELMDKTTSDSNGYYVLKSPYDTEHNLVCLDAAEEPDFNDLIVSKVTPTETL